jgi:hypothetical protein
MTDDGDGRPGDSGRMSTPDTPEASVLEDAAQAFVEATANPPYLFDLPVEEGRKTVDTAQDGDPGMRAAFLRSWPQPGP